MAPDPEELEIRGGFDMTEERLVRPHVSLTTDLPSNTDHKAGKCDAIQSLIDMLCTIVVLNVGGGS